MNQSQRIPDTKERLHKVLAHAGLGSRRFCESLIREGRVKVNGRVVREMGLKVDPSRDQIEIDGTSLPTNIRRRYFVLNKPPGYLSTAKDPQGRPTVMDLLHEEGRFYPVGRLDLSSRGLMLITNDGFIANRMLHPRFSVPKKYVVKVRGAVTPEKLRSLKSGVELEEGIALAHKIRVLGSERGVTLLEIVLRQGWKRQIRRMCQSVGLEVVDLVRTEMGPLRLKNLGEGEYRELTREEIDNLFQVLLSAR